MSSSIEIIFENSKIPRNMSSWELVIVDMVFSINNPLARDIIDKNTDVSISYHWYTKDMEVYRWDNKRSPITKTQNHDNEYKTLLHITPPEKSGVFYFKLDIVEEGVQWFCASELINTVPIKIHVKKNIKSFLKKKVKIIDQKLDYNLRGLYYNITKKAQLKNLKNYGKGKRCFIIGNGPSLNNVDITLLRDEITFGVNGIFLLFEKMGFQPTYYFVEDYLVMEDRHEDIEKYVTQSTRFFLRDYTKYIKKHDKTYFIDYFSVYGYKKFPHFSKHPTKYLWPGGTVTYLCMQMAFYFGFNEVYLIGFDHSYTIPKSAEVHGYNITSTEDDINHFTPEYFGKGYRWHDPMVDRMEISYKKAKKVYEKHGRKIINATKGGHLEVFQRVEFESLFKTSDSQNVSEKKSHVNVIELQYSVPESMDVGFSLIIEIFMNFCHSKLAQMKLDWENIYLSYHWYSEDMSVYRWDNNRCKLSFYCFEKKGFPILIDVPDKQGVFYLQIDIVEEKKQWFTLSGLLDSKFYKVVVDDKLIKYRAEYFKQNEDNVEEVNRLLADEKSIFVLSRIIRYTKNGKTHFESIYEGHEYSVIELFNSENYKNEVIVDVGAADGDSLDVFLNIFGSDGISKIISFEPVKERCDELIIKAKNIKDVDVEVFQIGLSDKNETAEINFLPNRPGASYISGTGFDGIGDVTACADTRTIELKKLDDVLHSDYKVTYIKMDIEGSEYSALLGAEKVIKRDKPRLAICLYHQAEDYLRIPKLVKEMVPEYKLFIRHHGNGIVGTVLYATCE
ncbi:MAG: FkbM family methyltransferase [Oscillospiraceae bacterium]|nr:FkbM family methyltransferase [Oscillospiraceae bacterium]